MALSGTNGSALARIIKALAELHSSGEEDPSKEIVGLWSGVDPSCSTMRNALAALKKKGLIIPKTLQLTQKGHDEACKLDIDLPKSDQEFHNTFKNKIKGSKKSVEVYELLQYGPPLTKQQIAQKIGIDVTKSTFRNTMVPLNKLKFLEEIEGKRFRLAEKLFPLRREYGKTTNA